MNIKPLVTVLVPAYNHEKYIVECLESIANQTYKNIQWIVIDDGSKDSTPKILQELQPKYGYQLILQKNKGLSKTLTDTLSIYAKGEYIAICASDDSWLPEKLEKQVDYMENNLDCAIVYGKTHNIDTNSKILPDDNRDYKGGYIFEEIITQKFHPPVNYMYRHDVLKKVGYYPSGIIAEDFYMNCVLSHDYKFGYIPEYLGYYRVAELSSKRSPILLYKSHEWTINMYKNEKIYKKAIMRHNLRSFYYLSLYKNSKLEALKYAMKSAIFFYKTEYIKAFYYMFRYWK